ncbi:Ribosomal silencing factor RsfS [bioreactor metagenome]|uniref:Ribosomal silencing factor RsfS n=1 Tax=bioreactor metagenome TaxID=1076179 RepID=A0A645G4J6_9ZZZZ|nr:ribosome silencing factor [Erysipelotrichaceae bacterium]
MNELLKTIVKAIDDKQGCDINVLDFRTASPLMDYFVITHVNNHRLLRAIADHTIEQIEKAGYAIRAVEGTEDSGWLLIDAYDVIIHIFLLEQRNYYGLDKLWGDLPQVNLNEIL